MVSVCVREALSEPVLRRAGLSCCWISALSKGKVLAGTVPLQGSTELLPADPKGKQQQLGCRGFCLSENTPADPALAQRDELHQL